jgi:ribonucleoside-triphosphate reductase (thioredoxin)
MKIITPWSSVGYLTYKRTYAQTGPDGTVEEFPDTVDRVLNACRTQLNVGFTEDEEDRLAEYLLTLKGSVAGRFLWQLGRTTVDRFGLASLQNCAFCVVDEPIRPFCWTMDMLALGAGVGFSVQRKHVEKLPPVTSWFQPPTRVEDAGADFIVPDSREGWCKLLGKVLKAAFLSEDETKGTFTYSTQVIRGKGTPIKGFGGVASGPHDLCAGMDKISEVLMRRRGRKLRPIDALDIMCIIGAIIVAGNVRRSALLALGDPDDVEYLLAKRWDMGNIPSHRGMSNNSVVCDNIGDLHEYFWQSYEGRGEAMGLINLNLASKVGRLGETEYPDPGVEGVNPCAEQTLDPWETCCLADIFLPNIETKEQLFDVVELLYRVCKHSLLLPAHQPQTEKIVQKNMRMGIGVSGIQQASWEQNEWLDEAYLYLREFDKNYSDANGMNRSVKLTTVKPSGTLSLLPGITPGIHPGYARYMYRRIQVAAEHSLVKLCRKHGYPVEFKQNLDGSEDYSTVVVTFPFSYPEGTRLAADMTAIDQLKEIRRLQTVWSDNAVSCTVYYTLEELPAVKAYLKRHYDDTIKSVSFMLKKDHGFPQTPFEEISKEEYERLSASVTPITGLGEALNMSDDAECAGGACPVR